MTWTAPAVARIKPPYLADERTRLDAPLDYHRATLLAKCAGLTGEQLAREGGEFALADAGAAEAEFAMYNEEVARSRLAVRGRSLDETFGDDTVTVDLRWLYAHMIAEYARHNGHADLIRELVDGVTGL